MRVTKVRRMHAAVAAIAICVPLLLVGNAMHVIAHDWFPNAEYGRLPPEPYGLTTSQRTKLAQKALDSIVPFGGGGRELREARLPDGRPAFNDRERRHMRDVRRYVLGLSLTHAIGLLVLAWLVVVRRTRPIVRDALVAGALLTFGIAAFVGVFVAISPVGFLGGFHRVFFSGDSWRFEETDTLRRLFPDRFWADTSIALGVLVGAQALLILAVAVIRARRGRGSAWPRLLRRR